MHEYDSGRSTISPSPFGHGPMTRRWARMTERSLSANHATVSAVNDVMSCMNATRFSRPFSISESRFSQAPVIAGEASAWSPRAEMRPIERSVARSVRPWRSRYSLSIRRSMVAARVAGVPRPDSFIASAASSSSTSRPAVSMARSRVASL